MNWTPKNGHRNKRASCCRIKSNRRFSYAKIV